MMQIRLVQPHVETADGYHHWITLGERVKANRLGISSRRMHETHWTKWVCNSGSCPAWALVPDDVIRGLLVGLDGRGGVLMSRKITCDECGGLPTLGKHHR